MLWAIWTKLLSLYTPSQPGPRAHDLQRRTAASRASFKTNSFLLLLLFSNNLQNSYFLALKLPQFWELKCTQTPSSSSSSWWWTRSWSWTWSAHDRHELWVRLCVCWFNFEQFDSFHKSQKEKRWKLVSDLSIAFHLLRSFLLAHKKRSAGPGNHELMRGRRMFVSLCVDPCPWQGKSKWNAWKAEPITEPAQH